MQQDKNYYLREEYSMLQKYTITSCAFILCLFASSITQAEYTRIIDTAHRIQLCEDMKGNSQAGNKLNCFKTLVLDLEAQKLEATKQHADVLAGWQREHEEANTRMMGGGRAGTVLFNLTEKQEELLSSEEACSKMDTTYTYIRSEQVEEMMIPRDRFTGLRPSGDWNPNERGLVDGYNDSLLQYKPNCPPPPLPAGPEFNHCTGNKMNVP
jgi:hypothetical protein